MRSAVLLWCVLVLVQSHSSRAHAETFVVTDSSSPQVIDLPGTDCDGSSGFGTGADTIDIVALCGGTTAPCEFPGISLPEAICAANLNDEPDIIVLQDTTYTVSSILNTWYGRNAFPYIISDITIEGNGATITRSGEEMRFFFVAGAFAESQAPTVSQVAPAGRLTLRNLTLQNGFVRGGASGGAGLGGAIYNEGSLALDGVLLASNTAIGGEASSGPGGGGGLSGDGGSEGGGFGTGHPDVDAGRDLLDPIARSGIGRATSGTGEGGFGGGGFNVQNGGFGGGGSQSGGDGGFGAGGGGRNGDGGFGGGGAEAALGTTSSEFGGAGGRSGAAGAGGGLGGAVFNTGTLSAINTTVSGNHATTGAGLAAKGMGGGIFNLGGDVQLRSVTFAGNTIFGVGPGVIGGTSGLDVYTKSWGRAGATVPMAYMGAATVDMHHCILGSAGNIALVNDANDASGVATTVTGSQNIVTSSGGAVPAGLSIAAAATLGALADHGGPTQTHELQLGMTSSMGCTDLVGAALTSDQRGVGRPSASCDPGAYQRAFACTMGTECASGSCDNGFCCDCDAGLDGDCTRCSVAAGASADGLCTPTSMGTSCGDGSDTDCTHPDGCDGAGVCLANHEPTDVRCGNNTDNECTDPDSCDGSGSCIANHAVDGTSCDDAMFCTTTSECSAGVCMGAMDSPCDASQTCNESTDRCLANCGNGSLDDGEECDEGADNSDTIPNACRTDCSQPSCGDDVIDETEQCDDGADNGTPASTCDPDCQLPPGTDAGTDAGVGSEVSGSGCSCSVGNGSSPLPTGGLACLVLGWLRRPRRRMAR